MNATANRNSEITAMVAELSAAVGHEVKHGQWVAAGEFAYRFDVCRHCGRRYANKRQRGVNYGIHNAHHYCTRGFCVPQCGGGPTSMAFEKALAELSAARVAPHNL